MATTDTTVIVSWCILRVPNNLVKAASNTKAMCNAIEPPHDNAARALCKKLDLFWDNGSASLASSFSRWIRAVSYGSRLTLTQGLGAIVERPSAGETSLILNLVGRAALDVPSTEVTLNLAVPDTPPSSTAETWLVVHQQAHIFGRPQSGGQITLDEGAIAVYNSGGVTNLGSVNAGSIVRQVQRIGAQLLQLILSRYILPAALNLHWHTDVAPPNRLILLSNPDSRRNPTVWGIPFKCLLSTPSDVNRPPGSVTINNVI
ncbi:hypothetical protein DFH08DRAFT_827826 [Mycena albidolilacea]|uniref:Uncharacterized protein n=1 Tax=Mycena albidolilacea TaxID=1033008 RepID=A0AAD6YXB1_9AGAR|nr:hypothetical protein DFH08DRAFT_827826 [Mycena albidolilacea]